MPNLYRLLSLSPAALEGALSLNEALGKGQIDRPTTHKIALAVANVNGCDYCNAAHSAIAAGLKVGADEIALARQGRASDPKTDAALHFARQVALSRGAVSEADLAALRAAGHSDAEAVEIVAIVAANVLTNYLNEVFKTDVDFPAVTPATRAA